MPENIPRKRTIKIDGRTYKLIVRRSVVELPHVPRLFVPTHLPNEQAKDILRACIKSIQHFTTIPYELWIIDNNSPRENTAWLLEYPGINVALSQTEPLPKEGRRRFWQLRKPAGQQQWGSYANAIGLELGTRLIDPQVHHIMTLHMDTMACHPNWLPFLLSKLSDSVRAAGVRMDTARVPEGILHVLGYVVDYQLFQKLHLDFFPQLPQYDVGDRVTVGLRTAGYEVFACANTLWQLELIQNIPPDSPFSIYMDRSFDDDGNIIFLHFGRGIAKTEGRHQKGTSPEEWCKLAEVLLHD